MFLETALGVAQVFLIEPTHPNDFLTQKITMPPHFLYVDRA